MQRFMRFFFNLLYHPFAFTYDLVAAAVSFGHWNDWVLSVLPFLTGTRLLELGHGPGHLQRILLDRGLFPVAIDESAQMGRLARRRLGHSQRLARGIAQRLPYPDHSFDTVVATFPSEYIFSVDTLSEVGRCLSDGGRFVVLPAAWPGNWFLKWLYRVTGESPAALNEDLLSRFRQPLSQAGFKTDIQIIEVKSGTVVMIIAQT
ncbi:MAG: methyltransferase domain-containing protein [Chloroflexi bacterium]|nr:methyltransferase domain-containing protein [Chloroflexota bacterium]